MSKRTMLCEGTAPATDSHAAAVTFLVFALTLYAIPAAADPWDGTILQYGESSVNAKTAARGQKR